MQYKTGIQNSSATSPLFGINLIGDFTGSIGLSVTARAIASLLQSHKVPFLILDVQFAKGNRQNDLPFIDHKVTTIEELRHPVNLYVLTAPTLQTLFSLCPALLNSPKMHIANIWWEASRFPESWISILSKFDGVLAMSHFIAEICRNALALTPIIYGEHPLDLPAHINNDRKQFNLSNKTIIFVASLDPNSDPARKNPSSVIKVFCAAFPEKNTDVQLILRLNNSETEIGQKVVAHMRELAQDDDRITILLKPMSYEEIISLYACADVYLSLHRGEGLGLGLLESMSLGKPVIATGWSGNLSFMNHSNSALLRYRMIQVSGIYPFLKPQFIGLDARWADPVLEDAVAWMRELYQNENLRKSMGEKAKKSALEYQQKAADAQWIEELKDLWQFKKHLPPAIEKYSNKLR